MSFKVKDHYFKKAKKENFLARSVYKLEEIDQKFKVLQPNKMVLDLGYFPGSWIQYTSKVVGQNGKVIGVDIKPVNKKLCALENVILFEKDIFELDQLDEFKEWDKFDIILSDMAPNTTGIRSVDQDRSLNLVESVFHLMETKLAAEGNIVIKVFDSSQAQAFLKEKKKLFKNFSYFRPKSTRSVSKEFFVIGHGYKHE